MDGQTHFFFLRKQNRGKFHVFEKKFYSTKNSTPPSLSPLLFQQLSLFLRFFWFINNTIDDYWLIIRNDRAQREQRSFFQIRSQILLHFLHLLDLLGHFVRYPHLLLFNQFWSYNPFSLFFFVFFSFLLNLSLSLSFSFFLSFSQTKKFKKKIV